MNNIETHNELEKISKRLIAIGDDFKHLVQSPRELKEIAIEITAYKARVNEIKYQAEKALLDMIGGFYVDFSESEQYKKANASKKDLKENYCKESELAKYHAERVSSSLQFTHAAINTCLYEIAKENKMLSLDEVPF